MHRLFAVAMLASLLGAGASLRADEKKPSPPIPFKKTNRVILDVGGPGSFDECQAKYPSILKVGDQWWMWYNGRAKDCFTGSIGLAVSDDGIAWTKRNQGRPVFRHGAKGEFDSTKVDHPTVLRFGGRFHLWYTAGDDRSRYTIGYATSADGLQWKRENNGRPVLRPGGKGKFDDEAVLHPSVLRDSNGLLHLWYNGVGPQRSFRVGHATSRDGVRWTRGNEGDPVLNPSVVGDFQEDYVYNVFVMLENDTYHMWYSAWNTKLANDAPNHNGIIHATSRDGAHWKKDRAPTLVNGSPGQLDNYACFACYVVRRDKAWWMYYSASSGSAGASGPYRVGLAIGPRP